MSRIVITGANVPAPDPPGSQPVIPVRLNLTTLINNDRQWSLYIQALTQFQQVDPFQPLSWFAISGIHGYPRGEQWQGAGPQTSAVGYCVHGLPHFPPWHRPYLALYEQALQAVALQVAQRYRTDTAAWVQAALALRAPYWDWADPATYLPPRQVYDSVRFRTVRVTTPDGPRDVPNPLLAYRFPTQRPIRWQYTQPTTVRHPRQDPAASIAAFEDEVRNSADRGDLKFDCWKTLSWTRTWLEFSNQGATQGQRANSLETLHNWMHGRIGGGGHMGDPISAAFDPIFMLHHANVDRQLALWQALHPDVWISAQTEPRYANLDLTPFWKTNSAFHRSVDATLRDVTGFKANYPEFVGLENLSANERRARIQARVDALYDPNNRRRGIVARSLDVASASAQPVAAAQGPQVPLQASVASVSVAAETRSRGPAPVAQSHAAQTHATPAPPAAPPAHAPPAAGHAPAAALTALQRFDWFIRIRVKKFALKQSYSVLFFLGPVPDNVADWRSSRYLVGNHSEFVNSDREHCLSCEENAELISEGFIDLDSSLERLGYGQKTEKEIEKFIYDEIHWRIQKADGHVVPAKDIDILEVAVMTVDVTDGDLEINPIHRDLTSQKPGGRVPGHKKYRL